MWTHPEVTQLNDDEGRQLADIACGLCGGTIHGGRSAGLYLPLSHVLAKAPMRGRLATHEAVARMIPHETAQRSGDPSADAAWREQMIERIRRRRLGHHDG